MADVVKVVNGGLAIVTNRIKGSGTEPKNIGWGIGTTAADVANTALESASVEAKTVGTTTQQTTTTTSDTYRVVGSITCTGATKAITEVGLFDDANNLFLRGTFSAINVNVADSIQFTTNTVFDQV